MAISYTIYPERQFVHVIGTGQQTMTEMIDAVDAVAEDPAFKPDYCVLFDLFQGDYTAELQDGDDFVVALKRRMPDFQNKFALIVPQYLHVLAKLYSVLAAVGGFDRMRCFL
ncbi:MAG: hypothetical protein ABFR33_08190, partial [Verrucomicrobiota bacterium]